MLNKEEYTPIELRKHCIKTMQFSNINSNAYKEHELILSILDENINMKYKLDQLESDKQKLIEKLEEDKETLKKENADGTLQDYVIRLLEILKGENKVTVK